MYHCHSNLEWDTLKYAGQNSSSRLRPIDDSQKMI